MELVTLDRATLEKMLQIWRISLFRPVDPTALEGRFGRVLSQFERGFGEKSCFRPAKRVRCSGNILKIGFMHVETY